MGSNRCTLRSHVSIILNSLIEVYTDRVIGCSELNFQVKCSPIEHTNDKKSYKMVLMYDSSRNKLRLGQKCLNRAVILISYTFRNLFDRVGNSV